MRCVIALLGAAVLLLVPLSTKSAHAISDTSSQSILSWIDNYRLHPEPARVPEAVRAMSRLGAFRDPESAGVYVGFIAGVLNANPARAEQLVEAILPLPPDHQWAIVRAIAYSGLPEWKGLLYAFAMHMPGRKAMIDRYLTGQMPTLAQFDDGPKDARGRSASKTAAIEPSPDLIDMLWGFYFATGAFEPIARLIAMLPWSQDDNDIEKLTLGGIAKYTLAANAARDHRLLAMLRWAVPHQPAASGKILGEVIDAAETVDTAHIRKETLAAIEELKRKGPGYRRKVAWWGQVGQGVLSLGCIAAAATGQVGLGLPCVIGGAASSAALNVWSAQQ
jgi:hypothetical protein